MKIRVEIEDKDQKYKEVINIDDPLSRDHFSYVDSDKAINEVRVNDDGILLYRNALTHKTFLKLKDDGYIKIRTSEGDLKFSIKVLELIKNNDNISIVYCVNDSVKSIKIYYLGV